MVQIYSHGLQTLRCGATFKPREGLVQLLSQASPFAHHLQGCARPGSGRVRVKGRRSGRGGREEHRQPLPQEGAVEPLAHPVRGEVLREAVHNAAALRGVEQVAPLHRQPQRPPRHSQDAQGRRPHRLLQQADDTLGAIHLRPVISTGKWRAKLSSTNTQYNSDSQAVARMNKKRDRLLATCSTRSPSSLTVSGGPVPATCRAMPNIDIACCTGCAPRLFSHSWPSPPDTISISCKYLPQHKSKRLKRLAKCFVPSGRERRTPAASLHRFPPA